MSQVDLSQNWRSGTHLSPPLLPGSSLKVGGQIRETWWFPSWRTWPQWRGPSQKQTVLRFRLDPKCSRQEPGKVKIERRRPRRALDKSPKNQLNWKILDPEVLSHYPGNSVLPGGKRVRKREPICTSASCKHAAEADRSLLWNPRAKIQICQASFRSEEKDKTESYLFGAAKTWLNFCIGGGRCRWHLFVGNGIVCIFVVRPPAIHLIWWNWIVRSIGKGGSLFWPA